jgi:hypothetical protein
MSRANALTDYIDLVSRFDDQGLKEAERKSLATAERIKRLQTTIGPAVNQQQDDRLIQEAIRNSDRLAKEQEKVARKAGESSESVASLAKALTIAHFAARGLQVTADAIDFKKAIDAGEFERAAEAADKLKKSVHELPVVGQAGEALGRIINSSPALFPGAKALRDFVARSAGAMTDDEVAAQDEEEAKRKAQAEQTQKSIDFRRKSAAAAEQLLLELTQETELDGKTVRQREEILSRRKLAGFNKQTEDLLGASGGGLSAANSAERTAAFNALHERVTFTTLDAFFDEVETGAKQMMDAVTSDLDGFFGEVEDHGERIVNAADDLETFFDQVEQGAERMARHAADVRGDTVETDLRTSGKPGEAAVHRIERELATALEKAGQNTDLRAALSRMRTPSSRRWSQAMVPLPSPRSSAIPTSPISARAATTRQGKQ